MKKIFSLMLAIVMTMGLMTTAAHACTADKDGNITPCEKVEENGYCDIAVIKGIDWEAGIMYQWNNPYYGTAKPAETQKPADNGGVQLGSSTITKEQAIEEAFMAVAMPGDVIDHDNYTITKTVDGVASIWVLDTETLIWTITEKATGEISTTPAAKPNYWYEDGVLVGTSTNQPTETDEPVETQKPVQYFDDVPENAWYYDAVNTMAANGIINGYSDGLFHPENNVTYAELASILYRLGTNDNPVNRPVPGHPEETHWASYAMYTLRKVGGDLRVFMQDKADWAIDRGRTAAAIVDFLDKTSKRLDNVHDYTVDNNPIPDWEEIVNPSTGYYKYNPLSKRDDFILNHWNENNILKAYNLGVINGKDSTGRFDPAGTLTRAELCQILYNAGLTQYTPADFTPSDYGCGYVSGG